MSSRREVRIRVAQLQRQTLIETKNRTTRLWSKKNVAVLTEDGAFARGFGSSRVPTPGNLSPKAIKLLMSGGQPGVGLGSSGID